MHLLNKRGKYYRSKHQKFLLNISNSRQDLTSIWRLTYFLPCLYCKQTPSSYCHPFPLSESGDDLSSPLSLPLTPRSLFFSSLLFFTVEHKLLLGPCGPLPLLSAPLLLLPCHHLSPALLLSPSPPPVEAIVAQTVLLGSYYFMSLTTSLRLFLQSFFLPSVPLPSLSLLGIKLRDKQLRCDIQQSTTGGQKYFNKKKKKRISQLTQVTEGHWLHRFSPTWT